MVISVHFISIGWRRLKRYEATRFYVIHTLCMSVMPQQWLWWYFAAARGIMTLLKDHDQLLKRYLEDSYRSSLANYSNAHINFNWRSNIERKMKVITINISPVALLFRIHNIVRLGHENLICSLLKSNKKYHRTDTHWSSNIKRRDLISIPIARSLQCLTLSLVGQRNSFLQLDAHRLIPFFQYYSFSLKNGIHIICRIWSSSWAHLIYENDGWIKSGKN